MLTVARASSPLSRRCGVTPYGARRFALVLAVVLATVLPAACSGTGHADARPVPPARRAVDRSRLAQADLEIFMVVTASQDQIDGVRVRLTKDADVAHFAFLTKASAYADLKRLTGPCEPELLQGITPAALPTSFRVETVHGAHVSRVAARYRTAAGVKEVVAPLKPVTTTSRPCPQS